MNERGCADAIANSRRGAAAENLWTDRQMKLVHEITPEEGVIDFTAALAQEALHLPFFAQPVEGGLEIHFGFSEDRHFGTQVAQLSDPTFVSSLNRAPRLAVRSWSTRHAASSMSALSPSH